MDDKKAPKGELEIDRLERFKGRYMSEETRNELKGMTGEEVERERVYIPISKAALLRKWKEFNHNKNQFYHQD